MLSASVASDVVFSSNVSLGEELDSDDLQADNSPKETHRRKIIIAVKSRYFLSLDLVILIYPPSLLVLHSIAYRFFKLNNCFLQLISRKRVIAFKQLPRRINVPSVIFH